MRLNLAAFEAINLPANLDCRLFRSQRHIHPAEVGEGSEGAGVSRNPDRLTWRSFRPLLP